MRWFRRNPDLSQALHRFTSEADVTRVSRLLRDGSRCYYALTGNELPQLLKQGNAVVIQGQKDLWGVAVVSLRTHQTTWLRAVALVKGIHVTGSLQKLLCPLHDSLRDQGIAHIYYAGDSATDSWLVPSLREIGYGQDTEVIIYEKRTMEIPSYGNQQVTIRPAVAQDLYPIHILDRTCFEVHWTKDDTILSTALGSSEGIFFVAEYQRRIVGYAYATHHFGGRLFHLVRLAVDPRNRGEAIGVRLLAEIVGIAQEHNAQLITLNTQAYNERAQQLYGWFGFVNSGETQPILRYDLVQ
jgi:GNAT superfamily N-acetyltransferase